MHRLLRLTALPLLAAAATACQEDLRGGAACPGLCPEQSIAMRDTVLFPIVLDTTLVGYPPAGGEGVLLLALRPDTVETAVVLRFDQVPTEYTRVDLQPALSFDSAAVVLTLTGAQEIAVPLSIEIYDVDTLAADLDLDAVRATLRPDRLLTTIEFEAGDTIHTPLRLELPADEIGEKILDSLRVRLGIRFVSTSPQQLRIFSSRTASAPTLALVPVLASGPLSANVGVVSATPPGLGPQVPEMSDYTLVLQGSPPTPPGTLVVGGLPGRRIFMRFSFPVGLVETTTVVRAALIMTQIPNERAGPTDSVFIFPRAVLANPRLEPGKAALLLSDVGTLDLFPSGTRPIDGGELPINLAQLVRQWGGVDTTLVQRSIVLQAGEEGLFPQEIHFYSSEAADPEVRPRVRLTYIPRTRFGLP